MLIKHMIVLLVIATVTRSVWAEENRSFAVNIIDEATVGLVRGDDSNAFAAFSKLRKQWSTHSFPSHLTVKAQTLGESTEEKKGELVVAFEITGGPIAELVAVDYKGRFRVHELKTALTCDLKPVLNGAGVIYYIANETVYAFSGKTGTWDSYHVPGLPDVRWIGDAGHVPSFKEHGFDTESEKGIVIHRPDGVARFLADKGLWQFTPANTKAGG
jgi:hypothetical protein